MHSGFGDFVQFPMSVEQTEDRCTRDRGTMGAGGAPKLTALQCVGLVMFLPNLTELGSDSSCCKNLEKLDSPQGLMDVT